MGKLYTVEQAAEFLNVHVNTIRIWLRKGSLKGVKAGKYWRIKENQLKEFLKQQGGSNNNG